MESLYNTKDLLEIDYMQVFTELVKVEKTSNCVHRRVGSVLWYAKPKESKILATGANITPFPSPCIKTNSCTKHFTGYCPILHAEINCIYDYHNNLEIDKTQIEKDKLIMIATYSPCYECNKNLVKNGIKHIYYIYKHHRTNWEYLKDTMLSYKQLSEYEDLYNKLQNEEEIT